jgi:hypothetical protein
MVKRNFELASTSSCIRRISISRSKARGRARAFIAEHGGRVADVFVRRRPWRPGLGSFGAVRALEMMASHEIAAA